MRQTSATFKREQNRRERPRKEGVPESAEPPTELSEAKVLPIRPPTEASPFKAGSSVSQAFLTMLQLIQQQKALFTRWLGKRGYKESVRDSRRSSKVKKGTMLDHKAE